MKSDEPIQHRAAETRTRIKRVEAAIATTIVGHQRVIEDVIVCLLCSGHALIEGVPGLGKTSLIRALGEALDLGTSRIQFTPDLMPADIIGTNVLARSQTGVQEIVFQRGPIFTQILLADEINRATPKTQSALLEAMQEHAVTVGGLTYPLDSPFMVLATQNPLEMEGTYPLPEAQLDRFFFKIHVEYPDEAAIGEIIDRTTAGLESKIETVLDQHEILDMQRFIRLVPIAPEVKEYAIKLVLATHPKRSGVIDSVSRYVRYGASPRGAQSLVLAGKVYAMIDGRLNVDYEDIRRAALPGLRHRLIMSFEGEAEGMSPDAVIQEIVEKTGVSPRA